MPLKLEGGPRATKCCVSMQTGCVATGAGKAGAGGHVWGAWEARRPLRLQFVSRRPAHLHSSLPVPQIAQQRAEKKKVKIFDESISIYKNEGKKEKVKRWVSKQVITARCVRAEREK